MPLGELLVRMGCITRHDLQTALARKMGYPLVNVGAFPIETEALRKLTYATAQRLHALPLMLRDGALIVALEDPSRRAALEEIEFACQCKAVPVLARHGDIAIALISKEEQQQGQAGFHGRKRFRRDCTAYRPPRAQLDGPPPRGRALCTPRGR